MKTVIARWSREHCKKSGWYITPERDDPKLEGYWNYIVKYSDNTFCFSCDGETPRPFNGHIDILEWDYAKFIMLSPTINQSFYRNLFSGMIVPDVSVASAKPIPAICRCDIQQLFNFGHDADCAERKK